MRDVLLTSVFFGILSALALTSICLLVRKARSRLSARVLLAATATLYCSTCVQWAFNFSATLAQAQHLNDLAPRANDSCVTLSPPIAEDNQKPPEAFLVSGQYSAFASGIALLINVLVGDAIVWWRAWVLWQRNAFVRVICVVLLTLTAAFGVIAISQFPRSFMPGIFYATNAIVTTAMALSLVSNACATALITYKAWRLRTTLKQYFGDERNDSLVLKACSLLIESGIVYCLIWTIAAVWYGIYLKFGSMKSLSKSSGWPRESENIVVGYVDAWLTPVIAAYPMLIIILVALRKSQLAQAQLDALNSASSEPVDVSIRFTSPQASGLGGEPDLEGNLPTVGKVREKGAIVPRDSEDSELHRCNQ